MKENIYKLIDIIAIIFIVIAGYIGLFAFPMFASVKNFLIFSGMAFAMSIVITFLICLAYKIGN